MKAKYEKELNKVNLLIETNLFYEEDYQMKMLRKNEIEGLAKVECQHVNGESIFIYDVSNTMSLRKKYELMELRYDDIYRLVEVLMRTVEEVQGYFLSPDGLVLDPSLIYWKKEKWSFLYLPVKKSNLNKAFHELTEYLVKTLDYKEAEGIRLASFLHKETLQENFSLRDIIGRYEENYKEPVEIKRVADEEESVPSEYGGEILYNEFAGVDEEEIYREEIDREGMDRERVNKEGIYKDGTDDERLYKGIYEDRTEEEGRYKGEIKESEYQGCGGRSSRSNNNEKSWKKEKKSLFGKGKESAKPRFRKNRWGDWGDLITD